MNTKSKFIIGLLALGLSAGFANAQGAGGQQRGGGQGGPGGPGGQRQMPPLMQALDPNQDGVIDADEIANASEALKKLDKNGDGKLTPDEYRPQAPGGPGGGRGGAGGQGGPGGGRGRGGQGGPGNPPPTQ
jgi:hypothetical protein